MRKLDVGVTFQIPKYEALAELLLMGNNRLKGKLFLSILPSSKLGHTSVLDWLNEPQRFFPFFSEESNQVEILNKDFLIEVVVENRLEADDQREILESNLWIERIEVQCNGHVTLVGDVVLDLPPNRARVLDFFNLQQPFFALQEKDRQHIINKKYVSCVKELTLLPPPTKAITSTKTTKRTRKKTP